MQTRGLRWGAPASAAATRGGKARSQRRRGSSEAPIRIQESRDSRVAGANLDSRALRLRASGSGLPPRTDLVGSSTLNASPYGPYRRPATPNASPPATLRTSGEGRSLGLPLGDALALATSQVFTFQVLTVQDRVLGRCSRNMSGDGAYFMLDIRSSSRIYCLSCRTTRSPLWCESRAATSSTAPRRVWTHRDMRTA